MRRTREAQSLGAAPRLRDKVTPIAWSLALTAVLVTGHAIADSAPSRLLLQRPGATADITLQGASVHIGQTSETAWTFTKTGSVDEAQGTITWTLTATQGATTSGHLIVNGTMSLYNAGTGGATIGNIVANLQTRAGRTWTTLSSDVADATDGDDATHADIYGGASSEGLDEFDENAASGSLSFMDAHSNTVFSLVPQKTIGAGETVTLLFTATYDNNVLSLPDGTPVRAEVIVSFGNAAASGASAPNIDINGNGTIDSDEEHVRSVPTRLGGQVPPESPGNANVTITDDDIATTGTVTVGAPTSDIGENGGTVTVTYDPGTDGGTVTNCAHLTGATTTTSSGGFTFTDVDGIDLEACDTETVEAQPSCTPGAPGCGWSDGDLVTHGQGDWGQAPLPGNAALLLQSNYGTVYTSGLLEVGISGTSGYSMLWTNVTDLLNFLPASGTSGPLTSDLLNPTSSVAGAFGGNVTALRLNIDFSDAGITGGTSGLHFGDLHLCNFTTLPSLNGLTVRQFQGVVNTLLGGGSSLYSIAQLDLPIANLNAAFVAGTATVFAQDHLVNGACPSSCTPGTPGCGWSDGDVITYTQGNWGDPPTTTNAAGLLLVDFDNVYASNFDVVEVGIPGTSGFSMRFTSASAVIAYLPVVGGVAALTSDLIDPTSSSSGVFGGDVLALELNVDFDDAGAITGAAGVHFGGLHVCGVASPAAVNGMTVREVLAAVNTTLGGGTGSLDVTDADTIAVALSGSFNNGAASTFAQQHLVNGACP